MSIVFNMLGVFMVVVAMILDIIFTHADKENNMWAFTVRLFGYLIALVLLCSLMVIGSAEISGTTI